MFVPKLMLKILNQALGRLLHRPNNLSPCTSIEASNRRCLSIGQPHPLTHPHLLAPGEVNSGLQRSEFAQRRSNLAEAIRQAGASKASSLLHASSKQHLVVIPSAQRSFMYDSIPYPFRQNTDYRY